MSRIIALDYGRKRTGIAVTDPLQLIATPLKILPSYKVLTFLKTYLATESLEIIVVGWPLQLDGEQGETTQLVRQFIRLLRRHIRHIPIMCYDERFTSKLAKQSIIQAGTIKKKQRRNMHIDDVSATFILRSFMASSAWRYHRQHAA